MPELSAGAVLDGTGLSAEAVRDLARHAESIGLDSVWLPQMPNQLEAGALLAGLAESTSRVRLGTAILPMYSRPPVVMAQTALTVDAMSGGRVELGLGLGHRAMGDWMVGGKAVPAVAGTVEYLGIVTALARTGEANVDGQWYAGHASFPGRVREDMPVLLGAFGPRMIEVAGEHADGVVIWMCTPQYLAEVIMPALRRGWARRGGRPDGFRVITMMHAAVTGEPETDGRLFGRLLGSYLRVATYRALFAASGFTEALAAGRADERMIRSLAVLDTDEAVKRVAAYREAGTDEIAVVATGSAQRSFDRYAQTLTAVHDVVARA